MVSSEAESEGSVLSEALRNDTDHFMPFSPDSYPEYQHLVQDKPVTTSPADWKSPGFMSSFASTRGTSYIVLLTFIGLLITTRLSTRNSSYVMSVCYLLGHSCLRIR